MIKLLFVLVPLFFMTCLSQTSLSAALFEKSKSEQIADLPEQYQDLGRGCKDQVSFNCCMASVRAMAKAKAVRREGAHCPPGYRGDMMRCEGSYAWCEKNDGIPGEIEALPVAYQDLGKSCLTDQGYECCLYNVEFMAKRSGVVKKPGQDCPQGYFLRVNYMETGEVPSFDEVKFHEALLAGRPVDRLIEGIIAPYVIDVRNASKRDISHALDEVLLMKDFYVKAEGEIYKSTLDEVYIELFDRVQANDVSLSDSDYRLLNKALLRKMYPEAIIDVNKCEGAFPWCQPRS